MKKLCYIIVSILFVFPINTSIYSQTCAGSPPTVVSFDITGYMAAGAFGNSGNTMNLICGLPPSGNIVGIQWSNYAYNTLGDTWCNEVFVDIDTNVVIYMITGGSFPGPCGPESGGSPLALQNAGLNFNASPAGCVAIQPYLSYTTPPVGAQFTSGIITLTACPMGIALPINLHRFEVKKAGLQNLIEWETASEVNNKYQIIERSPNGIDSWKEIGRIESKNNGQKENVYRVMDEMPLMLGYYRLKSEDYDGRTEYSVILDMLRKDLFGDKIQAIIVNEQKLSLEFITNNEMGIDCTIFDITGKAVDEINFSTIPGMNYFEIDINNLNSGVYFISIMNHRFKETRRFVRS